MTDLKVLETRKDELVQLTLELLNSALSGDPVNRTFYFQLDEKGKLTVGFIVYAGLRILSNNHFYTIKSHESIDFIDYGYNSLDEMDFEACGYKEMIENAIDNQITLISI